MTACRKIILCCSLRMTAMKRIYIMKNVLAKNDGVGGCGPWPVASGFKLLDSDLFAGVFARTDSTMWNLTSAPSAIISAWPMGQRFRQRLGLNLVKANNNKPFRGQIHSCSPPPRSMLFRPAVWCSSAELAPPLRRPTCPRQPVGKPPKQA